MEALVREGRDIPPFQISSTALAQSPVLKAVCSFETNQVCLPPRDFGSHSNIFGGRCEVLFCFCCTNDENY